MRRALQVSLLCALILAVAELGLSPGVASAQFSPQGPPRIQVTAPDGGLHVTVPGTVQVYGEDGGLVRIAILESIRLDVSATTAPGVTLGVSGVDGTVLRTDLAGPSLNALLHPECTQGLPELVQVGLTPRRLPVALGHADPATSWRLTNLSNNRRVCCLPSFDGGVPTIGCSPPTDGGVAYGYIADPGQGALEITGEGFTHEVYCRADTADPLVFAPVNVWEDSCIQP